MAANMGHRPTISKVRWMISRLSDAIEAIEAEEDEFGDLGDLSNCARDYVLALQWAEGKYGGDGDVPNGFAEVLAYLPKPIGGGL